MSKLQKAAKLTSLTHDARGASPPAFLLAASSKIALSVRTRGRCAMDGAHRCAISPSVPLDRKIALSVRTS